MQRSRVRACRATHGPTPFRLVRTIADCPSTRAVAAVFSKCVSKDCPTSRLFDSSASAKLLILTQVVLSFQLPFAVVPLVWFTAQRSKLGSLVAPIWLTVLASCIALLIIALNIKLISDLALGGTPSTGH